MDVDEMVQGRQQSDGTVEQNKDLGKTVMEEKGGAREGRRKVGEVSQCCLLYTSDAADEDISV